MTPKQTAFVAEYLVDLNATQAAIRAGYSAKTADQQASRLLANVKVAAAVKAGQAARAERTGVSQDAIVRELQRIAFGDLRGTMSWGPKGVRLKESKRLKADDAAAVAEVSETTTLNGGSLKIKRHDKVKALELLGRHVGMFVDKHELTGKDGAPLPGTTVIGGVTPEQLAQAVKAALEKV